MAVPTASVAVFGWLAGVRMAVRLIRMPVRLGGRRRVDMIVRMPVHPRLLAA